MSHRRASMPLHPQPTRRPWRRASISAAAAAALVLVGTTTAFAAGLPSGPSTTQVTGTRPQATRLPFTISDQVIGSVDVGTGNFNLQGRLLSLPGINGNPVIGESYNSLDSTSGSGALSAMNAKSWTLGVAGAGSLSLQADNSTVDFTAADGAVWPFKNTSGTYSAPAGLNALLTKGTSTYTLTYAESGTVVVFDSTTGLPQSVTDANGNTTAVNFTASNPTVTSTASATAARIATLAHNSSAGTTTISQTNGSATRQAVLTYNSSSQLASIKDAAGATTAFGYNSSGLLTTITNGRGELTTVTYDANRRVTQVSQANTTSGSPGTSTTRLAYPSSTSTEVADPDSNQSVSVDSAAHIAYTTDSNGLVENVVDQQGRTQAQTYNGNLLALKSTHGSGATAITSSNTFGSNSNWSLTGSQSTGGSSQSASYNNTGSSTKYLPSASTDDASNQTSYTYNGQGNQLSSTSASAAAAKVVYNSPNDGLVAAATAPGNGSNSTSYSYTNHQLTGITPVTGTSLKARALTYDSFGRLASESDGAGNTTHYTYDNDDRVLTTSFSDSTSTVTNTYDSAGNLTTQVSGSGTITNGWDQLNQLLTTSNSAAGGTEKYGYDLAGHQLTLTDGRGTTTQSYDNSGVLTQTTYPLGTGTATTTYTTDNQGRRTDEYLQHSTSAGSTTWQAHIHTNFDTDGKISQVSAAVGPDGSSSNVFNVTYSYNPATTGTTCGKAATGDRSKLQSTYDQDSQQTTIYCYDTSGRLLSVVQSGDINNHNDTYAYTYDANGDRSTAKVSGTDPSSQALTYNAADQVTSTGYSYDGAGNLIATPTATYTYNAAEQMTGATTLSNSHKIAYTYAGAAQNAVLSETDTSSSTTYNLIYGRTDPQGNPEIVGYQDNGNQAYLEPDPITGQANMLHTESGHEAAYVDDGINNPVALLTDFDTVGASYAYDPYGVPLVTPTGDGNSAKENPYSFKNGILDRLSGLVKFGQRWYNPATGSWTQQDTLDAPLDPTNANRYAYAGDDPVNNLDPRGLFSSLTSYLRSCLAGGGVGGLIGAFGGPEGFVAGLVIGCGFGLVEKRAEDEGYDSLASGVEAADKTDSYYDFAKTLIEFYED